MYQMWYGVSLYEKAVQQRARRSGAQREQEARGDQARSHRRSTSRSRSSTSQEAVKLNGDMWRAHYYLGRIYREQDKPKEAASEFTQGDARRTRASRVRTSRSASSTASGTTPMRRSRSTSQGAANVPGANEVSDIWYVLGMGYDDKRNDDKAIEAFDKAIETQARQPQGEVPARSGVLPQGRHDARQARPRGVLEVRRRVARVREAAGAEDADGHRGEGHGHGQAARAEAVARGDR